MAGGAPRHRDPPTGARLIQPGRGGPTSGGRDRSSTTSTAPTAPAQLRGIERQVPKAEKPSPRTGDETEPVRHPLRRHQQRQP